MGRQHTTWISEENWKKLENIPGKSVSSKIGKAISQADPDTQMWINANLRQLELCKITLQAIQHEVAADHVSVLDNISKLIEEVEHLWYEVSQ